MASFVYNKALEHFAQAHIDISSHTIKAALCTSSYSASQAADDAYDDISANVVGTPGTLASKTQTDGKIDAADLTFTALTGSAVSQIVIYKDSGTPSTSWLIARIDNYSGLPFTPDGTDITIQWATYIAQI